MKFSLVVAVATCCMVSAFALTECEKFRERELKAKSMVKLDIKCDANGDYEALQCLTGLRFCMCWRPDGTHITSPSMALKTCKCPVHRDTAFYKLVKGILGNFIPRCKNEGTYAKKQCDDFTGLCWCSDEDGNKVSEPVRGELTC